MRFYKEHENSILPQKNKTCEGCWNFYNYEDVTIPANKVFSLDLGLFVYEIPKENDKIVLEIQSHVIDKPWRIMGTFFFSHHFEKTITVPLLSETNCTIKAGEILFHAKFVSPTEVLHKLKGKRIFILF